MNRLTPLLRHAPLRPGKPLRRGTPLRPRPALPVGGSLTRSAKGGTGLRKTRLNPINRERRARLLLRQFGPPERRAWIASLPCITCGRRATAEAPNHNSHVRQTRAAGGGPDDVAPQCPACHRELEQVGREEFCRRRGRTVEDLDLAVDLIAEQWREKVRRETSAERSDL